nr:MAG TPA: hypothetical protein [Caudoviricetes sp.]
MMLPFLEEVKMTFGDYGRLFRCGKEKDAYGNDVNYVVSDYVDDEGVKELVIKEIPQYPNLLLVTFRTVMKAGTFNISDLIKIRREVERQVPNGNLSYYNLEHTLNFVLGMNRECVADEDTFAAMAINTIWEVEASLNKVMPTVRLQYGRS